MTPILSTVIKSDQGSTDATRLRGYLDNLIGGSPTLLPYRYVLIDVMALKTDSHVEVYEDREARERCASRASNPQDALRRYSDGRMQPWHRAVRERRPAPRGAERERAQPLARSRSRNEAWLPPAQAQDLWHRSLKPLVDRLAPVVDADRASLSGSRRTSPANP